MNLHLGETLRFFRNALNLMQKEMMETSKTPSTYSRIESGNRTTKVEDLFEILNTANINIYEFVSYSDFDTPQKNFREAYYAAAADLLNPEKKEKIMAYYNQLAAIKVKGVLELSNYISIKVFFHQFWADIPEINDEDKHAVFDILSSKTYFLQYDYILLSNMIYLLPADQREVLIKKAYPIKDEDKRDHITMKYAYTALPNLITIYMREDNFPAAKKYIEIASSLLKNQTDMKAKLEINYLRNLIQFIETGDIDYAGKLNNYVSILREIGHDDQANRTLQEIKDFTYKNLTGKAPTSTA